MQPFYLNVSLLFPQQHNKCYHTINRFQMNCPTAALQSHPRSWRPVDGMAVGSGWVLPSTPLFLRAFFTHWSREACALANPHAWDTGCGWANASAWPELLPLPVPHPVCLGSSQLRSHTPGSAVILAYLHKGAASCHSSGGIGNGNVV